MIMGWLFRTEIRKGFSASKVVHIFTKGGEDIQDQDG